MRFCDMNLDQFGMKMLPTNGFDLKQRDAVITLKVELIEISEYKHGKHLRKLKNE